MSNKIFEREIKYEITNYPGIVLLHSLGNDQYTLTISDSDVANVVLSSTEMLQLFIDMTIAIKKDVDGEIANMFDSLRDTPPIVQDYVSHGGRLEDVKSIKIQPQRFTNFKVGDWFKVYGDPNTNEADRFTDIAVSQISGDDGDIVHYFYPEKRTDRHDWRVSKEAFLQRLNLSPKTIKLADGDKALIS